MRVKPNIFFWYDTKDRLHEVEYKTGGVSVGESLIENDDCIATWGGEPVFFLGMMERTLIL